MTVRSDTFDPVWGTLGAPSPTGNGGWPARNDEEEGALVAVQLLGDGLHLLGEIHTGQFDRLSGWLNMQAGFIQVRNAVHIRPGDAPDEGHQKGTLWVRLNQIVLVIDRSAIQQIRPGAPIVQKERREVSMLTRAFELRGGIHLPADGSMAHFLEATDPHFLPATDVTVRWMSSPAHVARFPFALVNREQLVTVVEETEQATHDLVREEVRSA
jgi:hypothetical protein